MYEYGSLLLSIFHATAFRSLNQQPVCRRKMAPAVDTRKIYNYIIAIPVCEHSTPASLKWSQLELPHPL